MGKPRRGRVTARRRFGQHFLEPPWVETLLTRMAPEPTDAFLEIGAGRGALTVPLAGRAARVLAVEIDRDLVRELTPRLPAHARVVNRDFLAMDPAEIFEFLAGPLRRRVAGNLPYNAAAPMLFRLFDLARGGEGFADATVMLQREVAERLTARPGTKSYGVLAILARVHADAALVLSLPPGAFRPAPKVRSAVVQLRFRPPVPTGPDPEAFTRLVREVFMHRRKTILNALKPPAARWQQPAGAVLAAAGIAPDRRPETLELAEFAALAQVLGTLPK